MSTGSWYPVTPFLAKLPGYEGTINFTIRIELPPTDFFELQPPINSSNSSYEYFASRNFENAYNNMTDDQIFSNVTKEIKLSFDAYKVQADRPKMTLACPPTHDIQRATGSQLRKRQNTHGDGSDVSVPIPNQGLSNPKQVPKFSEVCVVCAVKLMFILPTLGFIVGALEYKGHDGVLELLNDSTFWVPLIVTAAGMAGGDFIMWLNEIGCLKKIQSWLLRITIGQSGNSAYRTLQSPSTEGTEPPQRQRGQLQTAVEVTQPLLEPTNNINEGHNDRSISGPNQSPPLSNDGEIPPSLENQEPVRAEREDSEAGGPSTVTLQSLPPLEFATSDFMEWAGSGHRARYHRTTLRALETSKPYLERVVGNDYWVEKVLFAQRFPNSVTAIQYLEKTHIVPRALAVECGDWLYRNSLALKVSFNDFLDSCANEGFGDTDWRSDCLKQQQKTIRFFGYVNWGVEEFRILDQFNRVQYVGMGGPGRDVHEINPLPWVVALNFEEAKPDQKPPVRYTSVDVKLRKCTDKHNLNRAPGSDDEEDIDETTG
ncbi:MAG: hypothetical protein M1831_004218 [Alyxoria varia]|nr:MAG: hypothetical protein M1831_004218 [Alyxoria varia]